MNFHIITIFPKSFKSYINESILKRAQKKNLIHFSFYNPRDYTKDKHKKVDGRSYGGGPGMVLQAEPIILATHAAIKKNKRSKIIILSPRGKEFTTKEAQTLTKYKDIVLICGRYEGIDARVKKVLKATELSIGPYTLTGGELPAMVLMDAVSRRIPGVIGKEKSIEEKRIAGRNVYTRPQSIFYKKKRFMVPQVLLSGHHEKIDAFRKKGKEGP